MKLTEEQLEVARIELERRANEKRKLIERHATITEWEDLDNYANLSNDEIGEFWRSMYNLRNDCISYYSNSFLKALDKELNVIMKDIRDNYIEIVDSDGEIVDLQYNA